MSSRLKIFTFYAQPFGRVGPSYTCTEILNNVVSDDVESVVYASRDNGSPGRRFELVSSIPGKPFPYRPFTKASLHISAARFLRDVADAERGSALAYIWPGAPIGMVEKLASMGVPVVREMINTFDGYGDPIIAEAYRATGKARRGPVRARGIETDRRILSLVDFVFANNPFVEESLVQAGVPAGKRLPSSYGWNPQRLSGSRRALAPAQGATFLYVGDVSIQKGVHLLLKYWARSGVNGRLVLAGVVEPALRRHCGALLSRPDVLTPGFLTDIGAAYRSADAFVFPSLDEGGPQVTYEAAGCGLPLLVSPMGAGRIAQHGVNGFVREPHDGQGWITSLQTLAEDVELRRRMGAAASAAAREFTWEKVGARRREQFCEALSRSRAARRGGVSETSSALAAG